MVRVDLHCHSNLSDGSHPPEAVAGLLAKAGVRCAALTDHDTLDGLARFRKALASHEIAFLPGVEITAATDGEPLHLLAYGFDSSDPAVKDMLLSIRSQYFVTPTMMLQGFAGFCKSMLRRVRAEQADPRPKEFRTADIAAIIHRAGGLLFLAHPLVLHAEVTRLDAALDELKLQGLDGIEAIYGPYDNASRADLLSLAENHRLLVSFGTDFHGAATFPRLNSVGIEVEERHWDAFCAAIGDAIRC
jgi:predicted metal-dependent phosphoesterase TrpH